MSEVVDILTHQSDTPIRTMWIDPTESHIDDRYRDDLAVRNAVDEFMAKIAAENAQRLG